MLGIIFIVFCVFVLVPTILIGAELFAGIGVYGKFISEEDLDKFFGKNIEKYGRLNPYTESIFCSNEIGDDLPYIAKKKSMFFGWIIEDNGIIPRWSKWTSILNKEHGKLLKERGFKNIHDIKRFQ